MSLQRLPRDEGRRVPLRKIQEGGGVMSFLFLFGFIMVISGQIPAEEFTAEVFGLWALFSIADALWMKGR